MVGRSLVLWIADRHGAVLDDLARDVVGCVAMRLDTVARNASARDRARRELGLGLAFDTEPWRNQCRPDHLLRRPSFRALGYDARDVLRRDSFDADEPLTARQVADYASAHLDAQVPADPTIFQCPGHVLTSAAAIDNDIALAETTLKLVSQRALREPAEGDPHGHRRAVYATICVHPAMLTARTIRMIVDRYVRLDVDGYWVWAVGFSPSGVQMERVMRLVLALQQNSGRPACPGGVTHLWHAALARGAAAAIAGPDRGSVMFAPDALPPPPPEPDKERPGREVVTYHGAVLSGFSIKPRGKAARTAAFERNPCDCGHHEAGVPPQEHQAICAHNQWWRVQEARAGCVGSAEAATAVLRQRLPAAQRERAAVGLKTKLAVGWHRSVQDWAAAPVGWGSADGRAA